jgi:hypothetical protein
VGTRHLQLHSPTCCGVLECAHGCPVAHLCAPISRVCHVPLHVYSARRARRHALPPKPADGARGGGRGAAARGRASNHRHHWRAALHW